MHAEKLLLLLKEASDIRDVLRMKSKAFPIRSSGNSPNHGKAIARPEELAFKWKDLDAGKRMLWVVRAVNRGKLHTPKYHRTNRPIRLTDADVDRLLALKRLRNAMDEDWMFPNRIKKPGKKMKPGPFRHEELLGRVIQPVADELGLPHITWRLLRHWGAT